MAAPLSVKQNESYSMIHVHVTSSCTAIVKRIIK